MSILKVSYKSYAKLNMQRLEAHSFYELYFLLKGNRTVFLGEKSFPVSAGSVLLIPPHTLHKTMGNQPSERINIYISEDCLTEENLQFVQSHANAHIFVNEETAGVLRSLLTAATAEEVENDNLQAIANATLYYLKSSQVTKSTPTYSMELEKIIRYINEHYQENITIDDLCQRFFISKNSLFRLFHRYLQCTVVEYLLTLRLNHAKNYLVTTDMRMEDIAEACGFHSANYFSLIFKKKIGISPLRYRQSHHIDYT